MIIERNVDIIHDELGEFELFEYVNPDLGFKTICWRFEFFKYIKN